MFFSWVHALREECRAIIQCFPPQLVYCEKNLVLNDHLMLLFCFVFMKKTLNNLPTFSHVY